MQDMTKSGDCDLEMALEEDSHAQFSWTIAIGAEAQHVSHLIFQNCLEMHILL